MICYKSLNDVFIVTNYSPSFTVCLQTCMTVILRMVCVDGQATLASGNGLSIAEEIQVKVQDQKKMVVSLPLVSISLQNIHRSKRLLRYYIEKKLREKFPGFDLSIA